MPWFHDGFTALSLTNIRTANYAQLWFHDGFTGCSHGFSAYPITNIITAIYAQKWFHGWFHLVSVVAFALLGNIVYQVVTMKYGFKLVSIWFHYPLSEPMQLTDIHCSYMYLVVSPDSFTPALLHLVMVTLRHQPHTGHKSPVTGAHHTSQEHSTTTGHRTHHQTGSPHKPPAGHTITPQLGI